MQVKGKNNFTVKILILYFNVSCHNIQFNKENSITQKQFLLLINYFITKNINFLKII